MEWRPVVLCAVVFLLTDQPTSANDSKCEDYIFESREVDSCINRTILENLPECEEIGSLEECQNWCQAAESERETQLRVLDGPRGEIELTIPVSPLHCCHDCFSVKLLPVPSVDSDVSAASCRSIPTMASPDVQPTTVLEHSSYQTVWNKYNQEMVLKFEYVYSGCYQLDVRPHKGGNSRQPCLTLPFPVVTGYTKQLLATSSPDIAIVYLPQSESLDVPINFGKSFGADSIPRTAIVRLNSLTNLEEDEDCSETGDLEACCKLDADINQFSSPVGERRCLCVWEGSILKCAFSNIKNGIYCVHIELDDVRCTSHTLWTENSTFCRWHSDINAYGVKSNHVVTGNRESGVLVPLILVAVFVFGLVFALGVCTYYRLYGTRALFASTPLTWNKGKYNPMFRSELQTREQHPPKRVKVLLLYPADCQPFMQAMATFRNILKENMDVQVYDCWDKDLENEVAESTRRWALGYLNDRDVRVVVVASALSSALHDGLLARRGITFLQPHPFDSVFSVALSRILETTHTDYNKLFVVRLDGVGFEELSLKFVNPMTVFTLPQQLYNLNCAIHNVDSSGVSVNCEKWELTRELSEAVSELNRFKQSRPHYLDTIVRFEPKS